MDKRRKYWFHAGRQRCCVNSWRPRPKKLAFGQYYDEAKIQYSWQIWETVQIKVNVNFNLDGIISSTLRLIKNPGPNRKKNSYLKPTKPTETDGSTFPNSFKAGKFQVDFRTDNSIKNHFYSTIRRSLRRICKLLGNKNSTSELRNIKPSILSKIF